MMQYIICVCVSVAKLLLLLLHLNEVRAHYRHWSENMIQKMCLFYRMFEPVNLSENDFYVYLGTGIQ